MKIDVRIFAIFCFGLIHRTASLKLPVSLLIHVKAYVGLWYRFWLVSVTHHSERCQHGTALFVLLYHYHRFWCYIKVAVEPAKWPLGCINIETTSGKSNDPGLQTQWTIISRFRCSTLWFCRGSTPHRYLLPLKANGRLTWIVGWRPGKWKSSHFSTIAQLSNALTTNPCHSYAE